MSYRDLKPIDIDTKLYSTITSAPSPPTHLKSRLPPRWNAESQTSQKSYTNLSHLSPMSSDNDSYDEGESFLNDNKSNYQFLGLENINYITNSVRNHEKYMKKRVKNIEVYEKMKIRLERYILERDALNLRIKECTIFIENCLAISKRDNTHIYSSTI